MVNGIDYGFTGEVTKIDVSQIRERLDSNSIVVVSNMGYSSSGEVLNCKYAFLIIIILYVFWWPIRGCHVACPEAATWPQAKGSKSI